VLVQRFVDVATACYRCPPFGLLVPLGAASPTHLSIMLSDQPTEIGVGCYVSGDLSWCVQDFGDR